MKENPTNLSPLLPFGNTTDDLLFWIKEFLIFKLSKFKKDKVKPDFDIAKHFRDIKACKTIEDVNEVARQIKPSMDSFYGLTMNLVRFYNCIEAMKLDSLTEITNPIFCDDFLMRYLEGKSRSVKVNNRSAVKQLFDHIELHNKYYDDGSPYLFHITKDIRGKTVKLARLKAPKVLPIWLTRAELEKLNNDLMTYAGYKKTTYDFDRARNVLMMKLLIYTGITASELVNLKVSDIAEVEAYGKNYIELNITGSSNADRTIPIPRAKMIRYLNAYMKLRDNPQNEYLFYGALHKEEQMKTQFVLGVVKEFFTHSGITKPKVTTEILRNTHAILLGNMEVQPKYIQERLGHKTLTATKEILKHCNRKLMEASMKFVVSDDFL